MSSLVDKSLVVAEDTGSALGYRLLETMRQYVQEKLVESGEAHHTRTRHRDHDMAIALAIDGVRVDHSDRVDEVDLDLDNLRAREQPGLEGEQVTDEKGVLSQHRSKRRSSVMAPARTASRNGCRVAAVQSRSSTPRRTAPLDVPAGYGR